MNFEPYIGHGAGLTTSVLWTVTSLFFTAAARRAGPTVVNTYRIFLAVGLLGVTHKLYAGAWVPDVVTGQVVFLALSGVVGLSIGDQALFHAFLDIGPRMAMLVMTTAPLFAALFGWLALGETLHAYAWGGMLLTIGGVAWVVLERPKVTTGGSVPHRLRGVLLAFVGAGCQAGGLLLSKQGMGHGWLPEDQRLDPQAATLVRMFFAALGMVPIFLYAARRDRKRRLAGLMPERRGSLRTGLLLASCGAVTGPFLGVWMSLVAGDRTAIGVAQTLCSLPPVLILPFAVWLHKEQIGARSALGAVLAVAGTAMLFVTP